MFDLDVPEETSHIPAAHVFRLLLLFFSFGRFAISITNSPTPHWHEVMMGCQPWGFGTVPQGRTLYWVTSWKHSVQTFLFISSPFEHEQPTHTLLARFQYKVTSFSGTKINFCSTAYHRQSSQPVRICFKYSRMGKSLPWLLQSYKLSFPADIFFPLKTLLRFTQKKSNCQFLTPIVILWFL